MLTRDQEIVSDPIAVRVSRIFHGTKIVALYVSPAV